MSDDLRAVLAKLDRIDHEVRSLRSGLDRVAAKMDRVSSRHERKLYHQIEALIGLYRTIDSLPTLPRLRGWALSADSAMTITDLVTRYQPRHVLECGSGASSVLLGILQQAGHIEVVTSLESDVAHYELTLGQLEAAGLQSAVHLEYSPLTDFTIDEQVWSWYDVRKISIPEVQLLLVDGPPAQVNPLARYPAVPMLRHALSPECIVVMDDLDRAGEQEVAQRWASEFGLVDFRIVGGLEKSIKVLQKESKYSNGETFYE